jgi:hypothetical protein
MLPCEFGFKSHRFRHANVLVRGAILLANSLFAHNSTATRVAVTRFSSCDWWNCIGPKHGAQFNFPFLSDWDFSSWSMVPIG